MKTTLHRATQPTTAHTSICFTALLAFTALLSFGSSAFANTDDQAIPPVVQKSTTADQIIAHVPDTVPLQGALTVTVGHPSALFVANPGYQTAFLADGLPVSFSANIIIATASPQIGTGYASQKSGFGMNLGKTLASPPATFVTFTGTIADTGPGIFALSA